MANDAAESEAQTQRATPCFERVFLESTPGCRIGNIAIWNAKDRFLRGTECRGLGGRGLWFQVRGAGRRVAISIASPIAAIIEPGLAVFLRAMSKAVPWSGLVRMMGRPMVTAPRSLRRRAESRCGRWREARLSRFHPQNAVGRHSHPA